MILERVIIENEHGLHARPAAEFVKAAVKFRCAIFLGRDEKELVNGKSVLGILTLAVEPGQSLLLKIDGKGNDEEEQRALGVLRPILQGNQ